MRITLNVLPFGMQRKGTVPMNSPLSYIGGKSKLSPIITRMMPAHKSYCEVFAGAAWVSFYRVLQNHLEEFLRQFKWLLSSHEWWEDWERQLAANGLTDIQKAARYYYVQRHSFGGKVKGKTWGAAIDHSPRINLIRMEEELSAVHMRLASVVIENMHWLDFVRKYDRATTFFYLDPPYYKLPFYNFNLITLDEYREMAAILKNVFGKFILSINDVPEMRETFKNFRISKYAVPYSTGTHRTKGRELLIRNF
jgi:DNA adenine methylase